MGVQLMCKQTTEKKKNKKICEVSNSAQQKLQTSEKKDGNVYGKMKGNIL